MGFFSIKNDNTKSFRIKKAFNELPVMENLKKRNPKIYRSDFNCPRCHKDKETLVHLWECSKATNDIIQLRLKARKKLFKLISQSKKFKNTDELFDELFPFFKSSKDLKRHTEANSKFYQNFDDKSFKQEYTYIWNGIDSIDNILKGWIPIRLISLLRRYLKRDSKKFIKQLLISWLGKIDNFFFEHIWKKRNDEMILWEIQHNISKQNKLKKNLIVSKRQSRSKKEQRDTNKILYSGKKKTSDHIFNEYLYDKMKDYFGLSRINFWGVLDKKL